MDLRKDHVEKFAADLDTLKRLAGMQLSFPVTADDTLRVTYTFFCDYVGNIETCLRAVGNIISDPSVITKADFTELNHGECLFENIVSRIREIEALCRDRI